MRKLAALAFALSSLALFAERDMAIYRGKLTSDLNANGNRITSVDLPLDAGDAANKEYVDAHGGGIDTNAVDILANSAVVTNALTVATTNRVAALETATNNLSSSVSSLTSSKADKAAPSYAGNLAALTADGNLADSGKMASDFLPAKDLGGDAYEVSANTTFKQLYGDALVIDPNNHWFWGARFFYDPSGSEAIYDDANEIAVKGDISATNPTFSNAVLAVGLNIDTNSVAVLNEISATFGGFPIKGTATTVGGLLAALAAAIAWLKKNKVGSFDSVGGATATVDNGVAKLDDFFTNSNSLLTGTIEARLPYPLYAVQSTGILKDRAINTTSLASVTVPDNFTDLLIRASVASSLSVTMPVAIATKYGDTFPAEAGEYLITITKTGVAEAYVRTIKLEVANA